MKRHFRWGGAVLLAGAALMGAYGWKTATPPGVIELGLGSEHSCAVLGSHELRCWGNGADGRLGYANTSSVGDDEAPAQVGNVDVGGRVAHVAAGGAHTCALLDTGNVRCWGEGDGGRLGYGNTRDIGDDETPASAGDVDVGGRVVQVAAGLAHTCALLDTGNVRCWGLGSTLGYGKRAHIGDDETPASAGDVDIGGAVEQIAVGGYHSCALLRGGQVRCWGGGGKGKLGYANNTNVGDDETPASAGDVQVGGAAVQLALGLTQSCALLDTGKVRCWGSGASGALGHSDLKDIGDDETPASAADVDVGIPTAKLAAGGHVMSGGHTCALSTRGSVRCWGAAGLGQLGYGNTNNIGDDETPASAADVDVGGRVVQVATNGSHTCALLDTGRVRCWGSAGVGQLGYGNTNSIGDDETPAAAGDVPLIVTHAQRLKQSS